MDNNNYGEFKTRKWLQYILIIIAVCIVGFLAYKAIIFIRNKYVSEKEKVEEREKKFDSSAFNSSYGIWIGTQYDTNVKNLLDDIISNNKKSNNHLIFVVYEKYNTSNIEEIANIKDKITPNKKYEVSFDYDKDGYINKITIVGTVDKNSFELTSFNDKYELFIGTKNGISIKYFLDDVILNNKKNTDHLIEIVFGNHNSTNSEEILLIKKEIEDWKEYSVALDYSDEGYVNKIIISKEEN